MQRQVEQRRALVFPAAFQPIRLLTRHGRVEVAAAADARGEKIGRDGAVAGPEHDPGRGDVVPAERGRARARSARDGTRALAPGESPPKMAESPADEEDDELYGTFALYPPPSAAASEARSSRARSRVASSWPR